MKKRLQREIDADSDADDESIRNISCPTVVEHSMSPPPPKRSRKDKFLNGDSSSEDELPVSAIQKARVLPPQSKEVFNMPNFLVNKDHHELSPRNEASMQSLAANAPIGAPRVPVSASYQAVSTGASLVSPITDNNFAMEDCRPAFTTSFSRANEDIILGKDNSRGLVYRINQYVARFLIDHQVEGIQWMFGKYAANDSAILGDDMGMGKTVQMAGLLNVIFMKSGTIDDKFIANYKRNGTLLEKLKEFTSPKPTTTSPSSRSLTSLFNGSINKDNVSIYKHYEKSKPILIMCPKSLVDNWEKELKTWGFFIIDVLSATGTVVNDDIVLRAKSQRSEIVLVSYSLVDRFIDDLKAIQWDLIVFDEGHKLKNEKSKSYKNIMLIKECSCRILLTGTPVQNHLKELWALFNLIFNGQFASKAEFVRDIEKPIKRGMSAKATSKAIKLRKQATKILHSLLKQCLLQRHKIMLQGHHALKGKDEIIVFCDLSPLQQVMYEQCLACPDFDNVRYYASMCPCQSGKRRCHCCPQYKVPLRRNKPIDYDYSQQINNDNSNRNNTKNLHLDIDPRAILWQQFHTNCQPCEGTILLSSPALLKELEKEKVNSIVAKNRTNINGDSEVDDDDDDEETEVDGNKQSNLKEENNKNKVSNNVKRITCPLCMLLPCLNKLGKIACHPALLQSDPTKQSIFKQRQAEEFLTQAFDASVVSALGGVQRSMRFMTMKSTHDSGKMKTLLEMLRFFMHHGDKTLIFSLSTQVLDLLEAMIKSEGWRFSRLDGQTALKKRQQMVDEFNHGHQSSSSTGPVSIFLMSSRAGGLGLNLNTANKVIIFDVDWNPTVDMQSQDRAYRIGQKDHVTVYRLVAKGTVEELAYMRQLYKQQLQQAVLGDKKDNNNNNVNNEEGKSNNIRRTGIKRGPFEGVEGESNMRGELFGVENLFQFSKSSILQALRARYRRKSNRLSSSSATNSFITVDSDTHYKSSAKFSENASSNAFTIDQPPGEAMDTILERSMSQEEVVSLLTDTSLMNITTAASSSSITPVKLQEVEDVDNTADAYQLLQSIGIRLKDARKNEDLLTSHGDIDENFLLVKTKRRKKKDFITDETEESENCDENEEEEKDEESASSSIFNDISDGSETENEEDDDIFSENELNESGSEDSKDFNGKDEDDNNEKDLFFINDKKFKSNHLHRWHSLLRPHRLYPSAVAAPSKGITDITPPRPVHAKITTSQDKPIPLRRRNPTKVLKDVFASPQATIVAPPKAKATMVTAKLHRPQYDQTLSFDMVSKRSDNDNAGKDERNANHINNDKRKSYTSSNITEKNDTNESNASKRSNVIVNLLEKDGNTNEQVTDDGDIEPVGKRLIIQHQNISKKNNSNSFFVKTISRRDIDISLQRKVVENNKKINKTYYLSSNSDGDNDKQRSSTAASKSNNNETNGRETHSNGNSSISMIDNNSSNTMNNNNNISIDNNNWNSKKDLSTSTATTTTITATTATTVPKKASKLYIPNYN